MRRKQLLEINRHHYILNMNEVNKKNIAEEMTAHVANVHARLENLSSQTREKRKNISKSIDTKFNN